MPFNPSMITTGLELFVHRVVRNCGIVRGIVVQSRSIFGAIGTSLQTLGGRNISLYSDCCKKTPEEALQLMMEHAAQLGANAVLCVRYDVNEI